MEYVENIQPTKAKNSKSDSKENPSNQKWAVLSISSIPLVMTLGNSMLIPVLPVMENKWDITFSIQYDYYHLLDCRHPFDPSCRILIRSYRQKESHHSELNHHSNRWTYFCMGGWKMDDPYWIILIGRALQGVGAAGAFPIVLPLVGDMFKTDEEVSSSLGLIETSNTLGKVLSPILGSFLAGFVWFIPFFSIPIFCLVSILLMWLLGKHRIRDKNQSHLKHL